MKTRFLLPHTFKKAGVIMAPVGFLCWLVAQEHGFDSIVRAVIPPKGKEDIPWNLAANQFWFLVSFMVVMFCSFLLGMLFLVFSREKIEDEYTQKTRLESFQFAALFQFLIYFILLVSAVVDTFLHKDSRFSSFVINQLPIPLILLFWILYFVRFNFVLHFKKPKEQID